LPVRAGYLRLNDRRLFKATLRLPYADLRQFMSSI